MIPHHRGAIAMCETLVEHANLEKDGFLEALCTNITRLQRAEIAWLHKWLAARGHSAVAPCGSCSDVLLVRPPAPCEDLLNVVILSLTRRRIVLQLLR